MSGRAAAEGSARRTAPPGVNVLDRRIITCIVCIIITTTAEDTAVGSTYDGRQVERRRDHLLHGCLIMLRIDLILPRFDVSSM